MTAPNPPTGPASSTGNFHRPHILAVTNDDDLKTFLVDGLVPGGFWLSIVASAIQTLEVLRLRSFDLLLIDDGLHGLPARELVLRIRERQQGSDRDVAPMLLLSDRGAPALANFSGDAAVDQVLVPPIELEDLVPLLHQRVVAWRARHPGVPWADEIAQLRPISTDQAGPARESEW